MRNWNIRNRWILLKLILSLSRAYEELKHIESKSTLFSLYKFIACLWGIETEFSYFCHLKLKLSLSRAYEELKLVILYVQLLFTSFVYRVPMRNWNYDNFSFPFLFTFSLSRAYEELKLLSGLYFVSKIESLSRAYEELKLLSGLYFVSKIESLSRAYEELKLKTIP